MSKGLEALKEYRNQQQGVCVHADDYLDIIEKELKALEIIKKNIGFRNLVMEFDYLIDGEEYDLLKEVLL